MPRKRGSMALRRWMRRDKTEHPHNWRPGASRSDLNAERDFIERLDFNERERARIANPTRYHRGNGL
jgi:hypothetical protein